MKVFSKVGLIVNNGKCQIMCPQITFYVTIFSTEKKNLIQRKTNESLRCLHQQIPNSNNLVRHDQFYAALHTSSLSQPTAHLQEIFMKKSNILIGKQQYILSESKVSTHKMYSTHLQYFQ